MLRSAQDSTGQGDNEQNPSHSDRPFMTLSESLQVISVPSVPSITNKIMQLIMNDEKTPHLATPIAAVVPTPHESPPRTLTNSGVQKTQVESDNDLDLRMKVLPVKLATLPKTSTSGHKQSWLLDKELSDDNHPGGDEYDETDEIYYSCADSIHNDDYDDDMRVERAGEINNDHDNKKVHDDKNNPYAQKGHLQAPGLLVIEPVTDIEFSEDEETEVMKLLGKTPILIMDRKKEIHPINAVIDTGAASSFISKGAVEEYGLKQRPIRDEDIKEFSNPISSENCRPVTYVDVQVKCKKIGINDFVIAKIRVLDGNGFDVIFGRPFIQRHEIFATLRKFDRSGYPIFALIGRRSEAQKSRDRMAKDKNLETALVLEQQKGQKDAVPFSKSQKTRSSIGSKSTTSTTSWDDASVRWTDKESSNTSWATTTGTKNSAADKSLRKS